MSECAGMQLQKLTAASRYESSEEDDEEEEDYEEDYDEDEEEEPKEGNGVHGKYSDLGRLHPPPSLSILFNLASPYDLHPLGQ
jgi:hypothetical protein